MMATDKLQAGHPRIERLEMRGITKRFPGVLANHQIDFEVRSGEVHALLGENGAGKSTLMKILYGLYQPDEGEIRLNDEEALIHSPADAIRLGIGMIHQHFMLVDNYSANAPGTWAKAIRLIDAADEKIDPAVEPECQLRLDDLKQYWYWYYLLDTEQAAKDSPELLEFLWKGQMSYMTAMHMVLHRAVGTGNLRLENVLPEELRRGPAHYTSQETAAWWQLLHERWPEIEVANFSDAVLADGRRGRDIDLNDLVRVTDYQSLTTGKPLLYNSAQAANYSFLTTAAGGQPDD